MSEIDHFSTSISLPGLVSSMLPPFAIELVERACDYVTRIPKPRAVKSGKVSLELATMGLLHGALSIAGSQTDKDSPCLGNLEHIGTGYAMAKILGIRRDRVIKLSHVSGHDVLSLAPGDLQADAGCSLPIPGLTFAPRPSETCWASGFCHRACMSRDGCPGNLT